MAHLGILMACEHYPDLPRAPRSIDRQLRLWLRALGHEVDRVTAHACHKGEIPATLGAADLWIVGGQPLEWTPCCRDLAGRLRAFLRAAAATGQPLLAVHHGEHVLHDALAELGASAPDSPRTIRAIRNPFLSFHARDRLFIFDPNIRRVVEAERPRELGFAHCFGMRREVA